MQPLILVHILYANGLAGMIRREDGLVSSWHIFSVCRGDEDEKPFEHFSGDLVFKSFDIEEIHEFIKDKLNNPVTRDNWDLFLRDYV